MQSRQEHEMKKPCYVVTCKDFDFWGRVGSRWETSGFGCGCLASRGQERWESAIQGLNSNTPA